MRIQPGVGSHLLQNDDHRDHRRRERAGQRKRRSADAEQLAQQRRARRPRGGRRHCEAALPSGKGGADGAAPTRSGERATACPPTARPHAPHGPRNQAAREEGTTPARRRKQPPQPQGGRRRRRPTRPRERRTTREQAARHCGEGTRDETSREPRPLGRRGRLCRHWPSLGCAVSAS